LGLPSLVALPLPLDSFFCSDSHPIELRFPLARGSGEVSAASRSPASLPGSRKATMFPLPLPLISAGASPTEPLDDFLHVTRILQARSTSRSSRGRAGQLPGTAKAASHSGRYGELQRLNFSSETEIAVRPYRQFARPRGGDTAADSKIKAAEEVAREECCPPLLLGPTTSERSYKWATGIS